MANRDGIFQRKREPSAPFYISYVDHLGRQRQQKLKGVHSITKARELRNLKLVEVQRAKSQGYVEPTKDSFTEYTPVYLKHQKARLTPKAYERTQGIMDNHLKPFFGAKPLAGIRKADIQQYLTARLAEVSDETARREFFVLRHLLQTAKDAELISVNHADGAKLPSPSAGRVRYLLPTELRTVLEACPEWLRPIAGLLVSTGMRRSNVLGLRWVDIDTQNRVARLQHTKNGEGHTVRLNDLALGVIGSLKVGTPTEHLFSVSPEKVSIAFLRACRRVGIADFRLHDLRHTAASWLRMKGADLQDVADVLGQKDLRMTKRYAHLSPAHMEATVKLLDVAFGADVKQLVIGGN